MVGDGGARWEDYDLDDHDTTTIMHGIKLYTMVLGNGMRRGGASMSHLALLQSGSPLGLKVGPRIHDIADLAPLLWSLNQRLHTLRRLRVAKRLLRLLEPNDTRH